MTSARKPGQPEPRDEMNPDQMARECGFSYERSGKPLDWTAFMELLHRQFEKNALARQRKAAA